MIYRLKIEKYYLTLLFLFSFVVESEFANTKFFVPLRYIFYFFVFAFFLMNLRFADKKMIVLCILLFMISIIGNISTHSGLQILATNMLYILPLGLINFDLFSSMNKSGIYTFFTTLLILLLYNYAGFLNRWNPNCIAYLLYYGLVSILFSIKERSTYHKLLFYALYFVSIVLLQSTSSRNIILSMVIVAVIVLFPKLFKHKTVYRITYLFSIMYSYLWIFISFGILKNEKVFNWLLYYSNLIFKKNSVFDGRIMLLDYGVQLIKENTFTYLFGHGHLIYDIKFAPHNNYIALVYSYGIIGTVFTAILLIIIFEKAYQQMMEGDYSSYVCFAILVGSFLQLGAESLLYGNDILILMPYVYMAYIVKKDIVRRNNLYSRSKDPAGIEKGCFVQ